MTLVQKANVVLEIKDSEVERYLDLGYDVINDRGEVVKKCTPNDLPSLRKAYIEHTTLISQLQEKIKHLEDSLNAEEEVKEEPKSKRTTKSKNAKQ